MKRTGLVVALATAVAAALSGRRERRAVDRHRRAAQERLQEGDRADPRRRPGRLDAGHYTAFNLGVQTTTKQARYGTFTIYLVSGGDVAADVKRLLTDPHTGELGTPATGGIYWEKDVTMSGTDIWMAKRPYGANVVIWWTTTSPVQKDRQDLDDAPQGADVGDEGRLRERETASTVLDGHCGAEIGLPSVRFLRHHVGQLRRGLHCGDENDVEASGRRRDDGVRARPARLHADRGGPALVRPRASSTGSRPTTWRTRRRAGPLSTGDPYSAANVAAEVGARPRAGRSSSATRRSASHS